MAALTVQIFGVKNSSATRAAERFFKERRFQIHYVDLQKKPLAPGEIKRFGDKFGGLAALLDTEGKEYANAGLKYLRVTDAEAARAYFRAHGVATSETTRIPGADRFFISDPDGNRIEIIDWETPYNPDENAPVVV